MTRTDHLPVTEAHLPLARTLAGLLDVRFALGARAHTVIGIGGESGSGKSVTAAALGRVLAERGLPTRLLHQDDWFRLPPRANHEARERDITHVGPSEVNTEALQAMMEAFRAGASDVPAPLLDFPGNRFLTQHYDFAGCRVLLIEGTYVLGMAGLDVRIFLAATHEDAVAQRMERAREVETPFITRVLAIEHALIAPYGATADIVVDRRFQVVRPAAGS
ncbi:MAG: hypothetical protein MUE41_07160 [Gemmatimonadaceae bacterium]|jgi:uridine kinase|nr:hypothetical protein [Gemmatimonadaceae bacterium]